ncbi:MAG: HyaD/HybD family hydrogenase maturation endopeptidase [Proteobacteria bacterium]|nr:MAG: HyaD/HybD family hydrogenase maturation endopeptidase [Pseudomonadota bacterium]
MSVLVLGVGNILLKDEGIGVRVIEELEKRYDFPKSVELLDGGTAGMELMNTMANRDCLILVDAVKTGAPPATVVRLAGDEVPAFFRAKVSPHQVGLSDVLAALTVTNEKPANVVVIGVVPKDLGTGLAMSPEIEEKMEEMIERVVAELSGVGLAPRRNGVAVG